ncbi:lipin Ned1 [Diatrype stigma]|uniref:Lipin Ned1 n=1 Tax=Diatrype stigma TaxID=117547 RepID=A0AAN9YRQ5_9PEZI
MQYVRNISDSVSTAWNSLNPATLSGAIDVIVVEQEDETLACSPFHVRFGKFSLLRPYEKKVEFRVNGIKQDYAMKLGEGGEAFFVFETADTIPQSLQTSPLASPASSPPLAPERGRSGSTASLQEPDFLELNAGATLKPNSTSPSRPGPSIVTSSLSPLATSPELPTTRPASRAWKGSNKQSSSEEVLPSAARLHPTHSTSGEESDEATQDADSLGRTQRARSPPPLAPKQAVQRAMTISKELSAVNIPSHLTATGDLMLDMTGHKSSEEDAIRAEVMARKILSEELQGDYDIGALFGMDEEGNLWIYSSEEAKEAAMKKTVDSLRPSSMSMDAASDPGYHSDESSSSIREPSHRRAESDVGQINISTPPTTPGSSTTAGDPNRNYAKTLRLTSDQLKDLKLKPGENSMSFTVNRATCQANMYLWKHSTPVVVSDIDGTITKSDALGQVLNMIGRDWTHAGVAKLYNDIITNGYNIMYLTSRSVGLADTTRAYLNGITQDGCRLPKGPTILSPDRTMAALRREIYLRKPHVFKMATLRDIRSLYGMDSRCFYAGFGNRLTDQISYRTVDIPRNRIFTINSNAEVSLDLLSLNKLKLTYINISEVVDHYFPPVGTLIKGGGEEYTDFTYWRDTPLELEDFSASEDEEEEEEDKEEDEEDGDDEDEEDDEVGQMGDSFLSRGEDDEEEDEDEDAVEDGDYEEDEQDAIVGSGSAAVEEGEDADDESEGDEGEDQDEEETGGAKLEEEQQGDAHRDASRSKTASPVPTPVAEAAATTPPRVTAHDVNAELITGMKHLGVERDAPAAQ